MPLPKEYQPPKNSIFINQGVLSSTFYKINKYPGQNKSISQVSTAHEEMRPRIVNNNYTGVNLKFKDPPLIN